MTLVLQHLDGPDPMRFSREIVKRVGSVERVEDLNHWARLATAIWNATPQPDRGGKSAHELFEEARSHLHQLPSVDSSRVSPAVKARLKFLIPMPVWLAHPEEPRRTVASPSTDRLLPES